LEPDYSFDEGSDELESQERASSGSYYQRPSGTGDTVAEARVYAREPRPVARRRHQTRAEEGMISNLVRGVARIFGLLFLAAGIGLWMVYFGAVYVLGLLGGAGMTPEDITNDLLFGLLSTLIALALLTWSRSDRVI